MKSRRVNLVVTACLTISLMVLVCVEPPSSAGAKSVEVKPNPTLPQDGGVYRVTLNGFLVNHESDDDILEGDGRRDEVFITADRVTLDGLGTPTNLGRVQSLVMGESFRHPGRVNAGTSEPGALDVGGEVGGLRTSDRFPSSEPYRRAENPRTDGRLPMLLWEGKLMEKENMVLIMPVVWEWDSPDQSTTQRFFDAYIERWVSRAAPSIMPVFVVWPSGRLPVFENGFLNIGGSPAGTRPIGLAGEAGFGGLDRTGMSLQAVILTQRSAEEAIRSSYIGRGNGVFQIRYTDRNARGDYTLFLQIERIPK